MNFPTGFGKIFCLFLPKTTFLRVFSQKTAPKNAFFIFLYVLRETHFAFFCESHFAFSFFSFSLKIHTILFPSRLSCSFKDGRIWHLLCEMSFGNPLFFRFFFFSVFFSIKKTLLRIIPLQGFWGIFFLFLFLIIHAFFGMFFCFFQMELAKKCQKGVTWNKLLYSISIVAGGFPVQS